MIKYNPKNERIKREYFSYQTEAKQKSDATLSGIRKAIDRFEVYTGFTCFSKFNKEQAVGFKKDLAKQKGMRSSSKTIQRWNKLEMLFFRCLLGRMCSVAIVL